MMLRDDYWTRVYAVSDRFGDYGTVGVMICHKDVVTRSWAIEYWLLSCRALGRQVEYLPSSTT